MGTKVQAWLRQRGRAPIGVWVLALGACMTLGFAPFNLWPVAVLSLAGLWWLVRHAASGRQAAGAALVWGIGHGVTALYWLPWAFFKDAGGSWLAAVGGGVPAVLGLAVYGALGVAVVSGGAWKIGEKFGWRRAAALWVVLWVLIEFIKGLHPMGFPWLPVGAVMGNSLYMMQAASVGGVWLLSALVLTMAVLVGTGGRRSLLVAAAVALVMAGFGAGRVIHQELRWAADDAAQETLMKAPDVRVVQPNIQSAHKWDAQKRWAFLQETLAVALDTTSGTVPATVIMPETAVAFYIDEEDDVRNAIASRLAAALPEHGALVTGTVRHGASADGTPNYFNSLAVMDVKGVLSGMYDKRLLVPFGEYIPARAWLERLPLPVAIRTISQSRIDFSHGSRDPVLSTPAGDAVGLICYEGIFPLQVNEAARRARYLVNITNDGWFTGTIALYQHAVHARLRAVETGLPVVRDANTGITLIYDGLGREVGRLPINTATHLDVKLPPALPPTFFSRALGTLAGV